LDADDPLDDEDEEEVTVTSKTFCFQCHIAKSVFSVVVCFVLIRVFLLTSVVSKKN
jgi:hypothetical protein